MTHLYWSTTGEGNSDLVLLHGWGLNSEVWRYITMPLSIHFRLHLVDLPGFGRSLGYGALTLDEMAEIIHRFFPKKAAVLGWSLGGLLASKLALYYPKQVTHLITVASSPRFSSDGRRWLGIKPNVLLSFQKQLNEDYQRTIDRFLSLQFFGISSVRKNMRILKNIILSQPIQKIEVLINALNILLEIDMRKEMDSLTIPLLRIYGDLDFLVPSKISDILDKRWKQSASLVIEKAAHAPFITHSQFFCKEIKNFIHSI